MLKLTAYLFHSTIGTLTRSAMAGIQSYLKESYEGLRKVAWPTRRETVNHTLAVICISLAVALFLGALDYGLQLGLERLL